MKIASTDYRELINKLELKAKTKKGVGFKKKIKDVTKTESICL